MVDLDLQMTECLGLNLQGHVALEWPLAKAEDAMIAAFGKLGVKVMITELDVDVLPKIDSSQSAEVSRRVVANAVLNPYAGGVPAAQQAALARRYAELFAVYLKHRDVVTRVTFWGVTDGDSWLNGWPVRGRTSYPLLFDRAGKPKPAFNSVVGLVRKSAHTSVNLLADSAIQPGAAATK